MRQLVIMLVMSIVGTANVQARENWEDYIPKKPVMRNVECSSMNVREFESFEVCRLMNSSSKKLVLFFHGAGSDARSLFRTDKPDSVLQKIRDSKMVMPSIISISTGRFSWLGTHRGNQYQAMASALQKLISNARQSTSVEQVILYGVSMGGFNALQMLIHHGDLFDKVLLSCPALTDANPFSDSSWDSDEDTKLAKPFIRAGFRFGLQREFGSSGGWTESNPMLALRSSPMRVRKAHSVLITTVGNDGFGFIKTPIRAARLLESRGLNVTHVKTESAEHCKPAPGAMADFLVN